MKAFIAALLISSSAFAASQLPLAISIGNGNVESGGTEYGKGLWLKKRDGTQLNLSCKGGLFSKNTMVLNLNGEVVAEGKVKDCVNVLREIYRVAFERNERREQYTIAFSDEPGKDGLYELSLGYSFSPEIAK